MAEQSQTFFDHIRRNFSARISESDERTDTLTLVEYYALLKSEILSTDSAYFVVDALDELPDVNEEGEETRAELLDILGTLSQKHQLFMTSRPHIKNPLSYDYNFQLTIEANADDLRLFITSKIAKSRRLASFTKTDKSLEAEIIKAITQKASGMFLLARLQLEQVLTALSARQIRKILAELSPKLSDVFADAIQRIESQGKQECALGMRTLAWVTSAKRLLTVSEITQAFSIEPDDLDLNESGIIDIELILGSCAGLLQLESSPDTAVASKGDGGKVLHFVHYTVQEYMTHRQKDLFLGAHLDMANTCMRYLAMGSNHINYWDLGRSRYPILGYAARFWLAHAARLDSHDLDPKMVVKICSRHNRRLCWKWLRLALPPELGLRPDVPVSFALAVATMYGAFNVVALLLKSGLPAQVEDDGWTPLSIAAGFCQPDCISMLLRAGAHVCARAVRRAIEAGNGQVLDYLAYGDLDILSSDEAIDILQAMSEIHASHIDAFNTSTIVQLESRLTGLLATPGLKQLNRRDRFRRGLPDEAILIIRGASPADDTAILSLVGQFLADISGDTKPHWVILCKKDYIFNGTIITSLKLIGGCDRGEVSWIETSGEHFIIYPFLQQWHRGDSNFFEYEILGQRWTVEFPLWLLESVQKGIIRFTQHDVLDTYESYAKLVASASSGCAGSRAILQAIRKDLSGNDSRVS